MCSGRGGRRGGRSLRQGDDSYHSAAMSEGPTAQRFDFLVFYDHCQVHTDIALTYIIARCSIHAAKYTAYSVAVPV